MEQRNRRNAKPIKNACHASKVAMVDGPASCHRKTVNIKGLMEHVSDSGTDQSVHRMDKGDTIALDTSLANCQVSTLKPKPTNMYTKYSCGAQ